LRGGKDCGQLLLRRRSLPKESAGRPDKKHRCASRTRLDATVMKYSSPDTENTPHPAERQLAARIEGKHGSRATRGKPKGANQAMRI